MSRIKSDLINNYIVIIVKIKDSHLRMRTNEIKNVMFLKKFESKIRYINKETGLMGALFPRTLDN